jgi:hypothetical protein
MGKWKAAAFPAGVACVLALAAWLDWWTDSVEELGVDLRVGLLGARVCGGGMCASVPADGTWAVLGPIVLALVAATALVFAALAFSLATGREHDGLRALAGRGATIVLAACAFAIGDALLEYSAMPSWGAFVAIAGAIAGIVAQKANVFADDFGAARSATPIAITPASSDKPMQRAAPRHELASCARSDRSRATACAPTIA